MTRVRLVFIVICALAIGLAAGYMLAYSGQFTIEERARAAVERVKQAIERVTQ